MADAPAAPAASSTAKGKGLARKLGPLPVWVWAVLLVAAWYWYEHYGPGAKSTAAATTSSDGGGGPVYDITKTINIFRRGRGGGRGRGGHHDHDHDSDVAFRETATGDESLDQVARKRHTTAAQIERTTRDSREISPANLARFEAYVAGGTDRRMPKGLVYYTEHAGEGPGGKIPVGSPGPPPTVPDVMKPGKPGAVITNPSAGSGGSTSGPAIADAEHAANPGRGTAPAKPRVTSPAGTAGMSRWRTAA